MKTRLKVVLFLICVAALSCGRDNDLWNATQSGDTNTLQSYLASGGDINRMIRYKLGRPQKGTMLHIAVQKTNSSTAEFLLRNGADANKMDDWGQTALIIAVTHGRADIVKRLLDAGANPNVQSASENDYHYSPLDYAAALGLTEIALLLLNAGADVNATNMVGSSALFVAKTPEVARILIAAGADLTVRSSTGDSAADFAFKNAQFDVLSVITNAPAWTNSVRR